VKERGGDSWLAVCMVSAEMLNCKLLSTQAARWPNFCYISIKELLKVSYSFKYITK
jgi:hypothetical protein